MVLTLRSTSQRARSVAVLQPNSLLCAEFAHGVVFNFNLKAGANQVHRSRMFQIWNESWNASTFKGNSYGTPHAKDRHNVKAFPLGGPIRIPVGSP